MKIGIYDPYLDTLGGGEKYILSIASCLKEKHEVFLFWDDSQILQKTDVRFGINLKNISLTKNVFSRNVSAIERLLTTRTFDAIFVLSDGSVPFVLSKKLFLHFQQPMQHLSKLSIKEKFKLWRVTSIFCNSQFTKSFIDKTFNANSLVIYPPVDLFPKNINKENIILTVGRFTRAVNAKKHEVLIDAFKRLYDSGLSNWKLVIIGSVLPGDKDYVEALRKKSGNYPIEIFDNISFESLANYYNRAKIYWHAAGFGEDLEKNPQFAEHFGISTVEAMGAGVVPVVFNGGGQKEIVQNGTSGFCWNNLDELYSLTKRLIDNQKLWEDMSKKAEERAKYFSSDRFCKQLEDLIK